MLYLADEMLKNRHKTFTLTIENPFLGKLSTRQRPRLSGLVCKDVVYKL